jgi:hypothetical protein
MPRISCRLLLIALFSTTASASTFAQLPAPLVGTWTGKVAQNKGTTGYSVIMTVSANSAETDYPELKCGGKLTRAGAANGYVFFTETITRGGRNSGGICIDGTITVAPTSDKLVWGWVGAFNNETFVAWGTLGRK